MELSIGDELAVLTFSNSSRIHLDPTSINQENKPGTSSTDSTLYILFRVQTVQYS